MFGGLSELSIISILRIIVDIAAVWFIFYKVLMLIRGTKAIQLLKGIFIVVIIAFLSSEQILDFPMLAFLSSQAITWGFVAIVVLFQPEIRRALEQLGRGSFFSRNVRSEEEETNRKIEAIVKSCNYMGKRRIGALITLERETGMGDYIETGIPVNGHLTFELLTNIFVPNTPLHDGAVILKENQIAAAACYLPLSESPFISKELGTRHRAAMGISEVTDALTIIVSEETGAISCTKNGELFRDITSDGLKEILMKEIGVPASGSKARRWRGKNG
jgi:diadenylate cyclase